MIALNLLSLFLVSIIILSVFRKKYLRIILSIIFGVFFCLQLSSLYLGNSFLDYKFFFHFNLTDTISIARGFIKEIILFSFLLIFIPFLFFFLSTKITDTNKGIKLLSVRATPSLINNKNYRFSKILIFITSNYFVKYSILFVALATIIFSKDGLYSNLREVYEITLTNEKEDPILKRDIEDLGKSESRSQGRNNKSNSILTKKSRDEKYTKKENLEAISGGKNIIIISLESFEKAFLNDANKELTPNLRNLKEKWSYFDMKQNEGSAWTAGSLYTLFTGFPCYFAGLGNSYFQYSKECKIVTIGDVLQKCGYISYHISDNADYAGIRDILKLFKVDSILDGTFHEKYQVSNMPWGGAYDKDIFSEAKELILRRNSQKPFFLFMTTLSTHCPNGYVDDRMLQFVKRQNTSLETAAISTDWLVGDFITFLNEEDLLNNTVVYIIPDHLMLCKPELIDKIKEKRSLWFMTNAQKNDLFINSDNFYQIDMAKNILSGAKIKHNAKFLADFIKEDKEHFIHKNLKRITAINSSNIIRDKTVREGLNFELKNNQIICLVNMDTIFVKTRDSIGDNNLVLPMNAELEVLPYNLVSDKELDTFCKGLPHYYLIVTLKDTYLNFVWAWDNEHKYKISKVASINLNSKNIQDILSIITPNFEIPNVKRGAIENNIPIKEFTLIDYLKEVLNDNSKIVLISAYDEASTYFGKLNSIFEEVRLKESLVNKYRWSYLSVFSKNKVYFESSSNKALFKKLSINRVVIYLKSGGFNSKSQSNIIINSKEYSMCRRGLNIVVFDQNINKVSDSFYVDTCGDASLTIMRE
jgi:hypothetical protein